MQVKKCFPAKFAARRVTNAPRSEGAGLRNAEEATSPAIANPPAAHTFILYECRGAGLPGNDFPGRRIWYPSEWELIRCRTAGFDSTQTQFANAGRKTGSSISRRNSEGAENSRFVPGDDCFKSRNGGQAKWYNLPASASPERPVFSLCNYLKNSLSRRPKLHLRREKLHLRCFSSGPM